MDERRTASLSDAGIWIQRIPVALEHAVVLRDQSGHRDPGADPDHRPPRYAFPARRRGYYRQYPDAALRVSRLDIAGSGDPADRPASGPGSVVRHERAAQPSGGE